MIKRYVVGFLSICLLVGLVACQSIYPLDNEVSLNQVAQNLNERKPLQKIELTDYGKQLNLQLISPRYRDFATNSTVEISGMIEKVDQLNMPYIWMQIEYLGDKRSSFHYYLPITKHKFSKQVRLFAGEGDYRVALRVPKAKNQEQFFTLATFRVHNVNHVIQKDIEYSLKAMDEKLTITTPKTGYQKKSQTFQLVGNYTKDKLLVQMSKGDQEWKKTISTSQGEFSEKLPLLFGKGVHEIKVMVPSNKDGYFQEGATFYLDNASPKSSQPIRYTKLYHQRGIQLITPLTSGGHVDLTYRIAGKIDKRASFAQQTTHVIVQTIKGKDKATYFLPVKDFRFDDDVPLRFGAGKYEVTLFVPDIENKNSDFFRFYNVATFQVTSHVDKDYRHLLPSRGITPNHPKIKKLAQEVTEGKKTNQQKAKAIYQYVAKFMTYDMQKLNNNSFAWDDGALKSLATGKGVCQDYVFLVLSMLRSLDIPARFVEGEAGNQRHAWVEVQLAGKWVTMDPTWGSGYITNGRFIKRYDPRYFDPDKAFFNRTHQRTGVVY